MTPHVRVLLIEERLFGEALHELLSAAHEIEAMGRVATAAEAVERFGGDPPDVVLLDVDLVDVDVVEDTANLKAMWPDTHVVLLAAGDDPELVANAVRAGASGYVAKTQGAEDLTAMIMRASTGEPVLTSAEVACMVRRHHASREKRSEAEDRLRQLTTREIEILRKVAEGMSTTEIAQALFIQRTTVQSHVQRILGKLSVRSKLEAVVFLARHGLGPIQKDA